MSRVPRSSAPVVASTLALLVLALAAPSDLLAPGAMAQSSGARTDRVDIQGSAFSPPHIAVLVGTTVTFTQKDTVAHTVKHTNGPNTWVERPFGPATGQSSVDAFTVTFSTVGSVTYVCSIHASMQGRVDVVQKFDDPVVPVRATDDFTFNPVYANVSVDQTIAWTNPGTARHTVTFENETIGDLGELAAGAEIKFKFLKPGSFRYRCVYHAGDDYETGMVGKVIVGGNPKFPTVLRITTPMDDSEVNGTQRVEGSVAVGLGQPEVSRVEVDIDGTGNWTVADGIQSWSLPWNTTRVPNGPFTLLVRAIAEETEAATAGIDVFVNNTVPASPTPDSEGGTPAPAWWVGLAVAAAVAWRRRP